MRGRVGQPSVNGRGRPIVNGWLCWHRAGRRPPRVRGPRDPEGTSHRKRHAVARRDRLLAIAFDYINGFHDTANAIATSVATRALRPQYALLMAAAFNFIGAFAGTAVAKTIGAGIVDEQTTTQVVVAAALIGAITWNLITWWLGLPSSSPATRSSAACSGATLVAAGVGAHQHRRRSSTRC